MLQHVIDAATASVLSEVVVVLGHRAGEIRAAIDPGPRGRVVECRDYQEGQGASLRAGVAAAAASKDCEAVAVLLGDQPSVTPALIDRMIEAAHRSGSPCARPLYSATDGRRVPGHPVVLARRLWPQIERLRGDRGARDILAEHPEWVCEVEVAGAPLLDVDVPADYEALV